MAPADEACGAVLGLVFVLAVVVAVVAVLSVLVVLVLGLGLGTLDVLDEGGQAGLLGVSDFFFLWKKLGILFYVLVRVFCCYSFFCFGLSSFTIPA